MRYKSSDIKDIIFRFTLLFALCSVVIWLPFILLGRTFVWNVDGISQHIPALIFFRKWLLEIIGSVFSGNPDIPMWSFSLGEGSDVIDTLHYYCIGDPLCLIVLFFPEKLMGVCYTLLSLIRIYLAGLTFIFFAREMKPKASSVAFICGGLIYSLSNWAMYCAVRHSFFLNPLILLPLMFLGIEKTGKGKRPYFFIAVTALSAVVSVYFFYMIVIMSIIYAVIRYPKVKKLLMMLLSGIAGCLIAAVILVPQIIFLMSDGRSGDRGGAVFFYDLEHYLTIPAGLACGSSSEYLLMGFGAAGVIALIYLLTKKGNVRLKIFSGIALLFMIFPVFGKVMNGFSYATNRWSFALTLLISFTVFAVWDDLIANIKDCFMKLMVIFGVYGIIVLAISIATNDAGPVTVQLISGFLLLMAAKMTSGSNNFRDGKLACLVLIVNLVINGLIPNTAMGADRTKDFLSTDLISLAMNTSDSAAVAGIGDANASYPVRYTGPYLNENTSAVFGTFSTQYYWSQTNGAVTAARRALAIPEYRDYYYTGYDGRAGLSYLAGARYYVVPEDQKDLIKAPIGYKDPVSAAGYVIYSTDNAAPFASFYDSAVPAGEWNKLSVTQKQDVMMTSVVLDQAGAGDKITTDALTLREETADISSNGKEVMPLDVECPCDGELYVVIKGMEYEGGSDRADISVSGKGVSYYTKDFNWYNGKSDFAVCLGRVEAGLRKPKITFTTPGAYKIKEISVELIPEDMITGKAQAVIERSSCIKDTKVKGDRVSFAISAPQDGYVLLQIPYSSGWKAYCDGAECGVMPADIMYTGLKVSQGDHRIELRYKTPGLLAGAVISLVSLVMLILTAVFLKKQSPRKEETEDMPADKILIAVASHKSYDMPEEEIYQPVLAGASVSEVFLPSGWKADNTGDNISGLNPYYCELTAYYWAVRNADPSVSYIGLVHYRRLFGKKRSGPVTEEEIRSYLPETRVFVPRPRNYFIDDLGSHYAHTLDASHLAQVRSALKKVSPDYVTFWDKILKDRDGYMFNMNIMERKLAEEYLDWLMKVLAEVCRNIDPSKGLSDFDRRFPGRLSELLFNCWLDREVAIGKIAPGSICELDYYSPEKVNWPKKIVSFLKAKFLGRKYHKSF